ncbi:hypothetical protein G6F35_011275 [Rhizopus arrhizus]|nr:hypothetical protein G6F35_011275 [Rhizopus arrhizus]
MRGHAACAPGRRSSQATAVAAASAAAIHISGEAADAAATGIAPGAAITTAPLLAGAVEPVRALVGEEEHIDHQRYRDRRGDIDGEPVDVAGLQRALVQQRGGTAEQRVGQCIAQAHAQCTHVGGEQFGLHHRVDRGVAGEDDEGHGQGQEGQGGVMLVRQLGDQVPAVQHAAHAEEHQQGLAADDVRQPATDRLQHHQERQHTQVDQGAGHRVVAGECALDHLRAVHRVGVEGHGATGGDQEAQQQRPPLVHEQFVHRAGLLCLAFACGLDGRLRQRLVHAPAQPEHHHRGDAADAEGDAPAPLGDFRLAPEGQHQQQGQLGQHMATDQGDVVERGQETAAAGNGGLGHMPMLAAVGVMAMRKEIG